MQMSCYYQRHSGKQVNRYTRAANPKSLAGSGMRYLVSDIQNWKKCPTFYKASEKWDTFHSMRIVNKG